MMRLGFGLAAVALAIGLAATPLFAHAEVRERAPAAGETIGGRVDHVDLSFWAPIESAEITLTGPEGQAVDVGETVIRRSGLITSVEFDPLTVAGNYTVTHAEVAADGDSQRAAYGFVFDPGSDRRLASLIERETGPNWLLLGAIGGVVLIGLLLFAPWRR
jgi:methionine-rich copper-binding protein CopC